MLLNFKINKKLKKNQKQKLIYKCRQKTRKIKIKKNCQLLQKNEAKNPEIKQKN